MPIDRSKDKTVDLHPKPPAPVGLPVAQPSAPVAQGDPDFDGEVTPARHTLGEKRPPHNAPSWMWHAYAEFKRNVHELPGKDANARILEYFKATNLGMNPLAYSDETPWCSAFANFVMQEAGYPTTKSASARSWLKWGQQSKPVYGAVTVFWRTNPSSISGHVAFYVGEEGSNIWVLGGNQNNSVSFAKYPRMRLLGYRMPL